ncbi:MAG: DarT ssDNA thymidine ADP-ribosyltransferase family protein [Gemmatimonadaceae bacterium]
MRKPDAHAIEAWVDGLPTALALGARRQWWTKCAFRFDDIQAVASILRTGKLLSRAECDRQRIPHRDAANQQVIAQSAHAQNVVRLYFRPLTPTQYRMEGVKARAQLPLTGEHCPVPVFLLFDLKGLLCRPGVSASDGSLARAGEYRRGDDAAFLASLPMAEVYHDGYITAPLVKGEIIFRRHAEVFVERELDLGQLKSIVCRTAAEQETLLHLLGADAPQWAAMVTLSPVGRDIFYRHNGHLVKEVRLLDDAVQFEVARPGGFEYDFVLTITDAETGVVLVEEAKRKNLSPIWSKACVGLPSRVEVRLLVDGCLAYHAVVSRQAVFVGR